MPKIVRADEQTLTKDQASLGAGAGRGGTSAPHPCSESHIEPSIQLGIGYNRGRQLHWNRRQEFHGPFALVHDLASSVLRVSATPSAS